ncbi:Disks large-associated protein 5 [Lonchura striata]|uniref:Disks large-associated protein 5 n=1 Tax=Lonchura striata TaxID=40157 RepID=A0A218UKM9_9PASE|nr:Disks large-associated protein 5 [Lonchura striata domestica]
MSVGGMAATSQFANRYKKDLSTEALRTRVARRKSILQKENRHKLFEKGRQLGLADVNAQPSKERGIPELKEPRELCFQENSSVKQKAAPNAATKRMNERREMLQRYKEEKELRKLQEQRERAKKGVFKVGLYRPAAPGFLALAAEEPAAAKPREKVSAQGQSVRSTQAGHKQMSTAKVAEKEKGNQSQRKAASVGKQKKAVKPDPIKVISSEHEVETNAGVDPGLRSSAADSKHSMPVELQQEQTSVENNNFSPRRPRTRSFAPQNFVFQPLSGLATYTVTPMSPSRANAFLTPSAVWKFSKSPVKIFEKSSETKAQRPNLKSQTSPSVEGIQEQQMTTSSKGGGESDERTSTQGSSKTTPVSTALAVKSDDTIEQEHDVPYFRNILRTERERLLSQCLQWEGNLELDIPEDAKDLIRSTVGQTRLLIGERFKQFEGLVDNCEFKRGEKETTCTDLDGFWDMIHFQIEDVNKKFVNLVKLQDNEWQPLDVPSKAVAKKKAVPSGVPKPKVEEAARAAARSRLASVKAAMRDKMKKGPAAESAHQERLPEAEKVVFEAGFFRIESPVKNFSGGISVVAEEMCLVAGTAEGNKVLGNSSSESKAVDGMEEMELSEQDKDRHLSEAAEQGQDIIMCSPEKETSSAQSGESQMHQTVFSNSDSTLWLLPQPMLDAELPFTPVKTRAQKFAAAEVFCDLIMFSPVGPSGDQ